jgi:GDPmannose 4,6-dehydratase
MRSIEKRNAVNAMIVGSEGQDGILMGELLSSMGISYDGINRGNCDISDYNQVAKLISNSKPRYLFYFAAQHTSATEEQNQERNRVYFDVNTMGVLNCLDAIKNISPDTHFFFTSSSLIFAPESYALLNERSALSLRDFYTISKHASMKLCELYREKFGIRTTVGIMFNHESRFRKSKFVSKKIVEYVAGLSRGSHGRLVLGDLDTVVDWGAAEDYMEAAFQLLASEKVGEYIFASGQGHTVRNFCEVAFSHVGLNYENYVSTQAESLVRINNTRIGDNSKLREAINWRPKITFEKMIENMVDAEVILKR